MMKPARFTSRPNFPSGQRGMVLLVSLVFLLLLTLLGISSMQNATLQEKMAGSVTLRNVSFQTAEALLRLGESAIKVSTTPPAVCGSVATCAPPAESTVVTSAGFNSGSGVTWVAVNGGFYGLQNLGPPAATLMKCSGTELSKITLYRVTAVAIQGTSRTVLESIYAVNC